MTSHNRPWKEKQVQEITQLSEKYPIIAVASLKNFPASLSQSLRKKLQGKAVVRASKTRLVKMALSASKAKTGELLNHVNGSIAVIFSEMNPFELYAFLKRNKGSVAAKPGMLAPQDIIVPAGDTGLPPGPALSDLKQAGLKTVVKGPTISVAEDKVVAKKGEKITLPVASVLAKLDIKPVKVGLNIVACLEKDQVFTADVLDIDTEKVFQQFADASTNAFNLAVEIAYTVPDTIELLLSNGFRNAKALSLEAGIMNSATAEELLAKGARQAAALKEALPEAPAAEAKEEKKGAVAVPAGKEKGAEEKPAEGKKEEPAAEGKKEEPAAEGKKEEPAAEGKKEGA